MHAKLPDQRKSVWQERITRSGYLVGAVLLHLIVFLLVATWVIWKAPLPPPNDVFQRVAIKPPPPPPAQPSSSGAEANNPQFEPQPVVVPVVTPPSVITSANSTFNVNAPKVLDQALSHFSDQMAQGTGLSAGAGGHDGTGSGNQLFGAVSGGGLVGDLYDMKQTSDQKPNSIANTKYEQDHPDVTAPGWPGFPSTREEIRILRNYVIDFDDNILRDYYHAPTPLFAPQIFIPELPAKEAPKAFGVEKTVQPRRWIVVYKAKIIPPVSGDFRFIGFGDDFLVVRIDNQNVLDGCWDKGLLAPGVNVNDDVGMAPPYTSDYNAPKMPLSCGPWIHMTAGIQMNLKVLIGEGPGGQSAFFLFIQQKGIDYPKGDYPVFHVADVPAACLYRSSRRTPLRSVARKWSSASTPNS